MINIPVEGIRLILILVYAVIVLNIVTASFRTSYTTMLTNICVAIVLELLVRGLYKFAGIITVAMMVFNTYRAIINQGSDKLFKQEVT